ncbi:MAG: DUF5063 domain-containing protein [Marmoricola sp.]
MSDELTSIATDLANGLRHFRAGDLDEALWWWQYSPRLMGWQRLWCFECTALHRGP